MGCFYIERDIEPERVYMYACIRERERERVCVCVCLTDPSSSPTRYSGCSSNLE